MTTRHDDATVSGYVVSLMPQTTSFFGLAALLIPVLLFTGYATQQLRAPQPLFQSRLRGTATRDLAVLLAVVVLFGLFPAFAELIALIAVLNGGDAPTFDTWFVAAAVAVGMWSVAGAVVSPWLQVLWRYSRAFKAGICLGVVGCLFGSVAVLGTGVDVQRLGFENKQLLARAERLTMRANLAVVPYDTTVAMSEAAEALLREELGGASPSRRAEIRKDIREILGLRFEVLAAKAVNETKSVLGDQSKRLEERAKKLEELMKP